MSSQQSQSGAISDKKDVQQMFDTIVPQYDLMNHIMTFGMDFRWRKMMAKQASKLQNGEPSDFVVDVACGTGDAMDMPFKDGIASAATISFGMRNLPDYAAGVKEMARIVKPGGKVICLEATPYHRPILKIPFNFYFNQVLPVIGKVLTGEYEAYKYLPDSVKNFPNPDELAEVFREAGLVDVKYNLLGFGSVALHTGVKA